MPWPDHVLIVVMENKEPGEVLNGRQAPYLTALAKEGASFTNAHAETHPSQPNYIARLSGSTQGVTDNDCGHAIAQPNLGSVSLGGRRTPVRRPRMRNDGSGELAVASYELFSGTEVLGRMAMERMLAGLSTRRYPAGLEPVGQRTEQAATSTSRSAVSGRFVAATETALAQPLTADLSPLDLVGLMIDGVHFGEHCCVVAPGIGIDGTKHPLALVEGSTENTSLVTELIVGLRERGLDVTHLPKRVPMALSRSGTAREVGVADLHHRRHLSARPYHRAWTTTPTEPPADQASPHPTGAVAAHRHQLAAVPGTQATSSDGRPRIAGAIDSPHRRSRRGCGGESSRAPVRPNNVHAASSTFAFLPSSAMPGGPTLTAFGSPAVHKPSGYVWPRVRARVILLIAKERRRGEERGS